MFERWERSDDVTVHDDGTASNEDRLGAIGDIRFVVERAGIDDDLLVIAGDNLFRFSLADYVDWWRGKGVASALAVHDVGALELARKYGIVELGEDERVVGFVEKPEDPPSTLAATASYLYHREHVPLVARYLDEGNQPDQPGRLIAWLHTREPVYGYVFEDEWLDVGDPAQLLEADNRMRRRSGLPERAEYALD
jgi:glucose-1-phosphate thymidylyltransferase